MLAYYHIYKGDEMMTSALAVGTAVRRSRSRRSLTQAELAEQANVTREWIIRLEAGAPRLEMELVLRTCGILGLGIATPPDELATEADIEMANDIAWSMELEGRKISHSAYDKLLDKIISDRLSQNKKQTKN
jgi:HTH-type transcriptional regulator/antitoxin HipB